MKTSLAAAVLVLGGALTACTPAYQAYNPVVDPATAPANRNYNQDLMECRNLAMQTRGEGDQALRSGAMGALGGAALGALAGWAAGAPATGAAVGAGVGALGGAAYGGSSAGGTQEDVIRRCMRGRGYNVLN